MSKNLIWAVKFLIGIGLAALLLWLVFQKVEWVPFWQRAMIVDYTWIIISIFLTVSADVVRAYRWNILLEPLGYHLKAYKTTLAVLVGYMANLAIPRLGEISRCGILYKNDKVPISEALGTVFSERLIDALTLLLLIGLSLAIEADLLMAFLGEASDSLSITTWVWILIVGIILLGGAIWMTSLKNRHRLIGKYAELLKGFWAGIISLKKIKKPVGFFVSTVVLWVLYFLMSYILVFSLPETAHLGLDAGFMLLITGSIAFSLPVQSGFGTYHGMVSGMLLLYGVENNTGIFLATLMHTSHVVATAIFGTIALIISFLIRRKNQK